MRHAAPSRGAPVTPVSQVFGGEIMARKERFHGQFVPGDIDDFPNTVVIPVNHIHRRLYERNEALPRPAWVCPP
jgi:hypothetical protein